MARTARFKLKNQSAWYHLYASVATHQGHYPLSEGLRGANTRRWINLIEHYSSIYFCEVAAFCVMGNHTHLVIRFDDPSPVEGSELMKRALKMYPHSRVQLNLWSREQWKRFENRLFDVSELMRNVQAAYARWYNAHHARKGRFWGERFKSTVLGSLHAVVDCMMYVELNPVRAGLVERPEDWQGGSLFFRETRKDKWLLSLTECWGVKKVYTDYKAHVYYRGEVPTKTSHKQIPEYIIKMEAKRGFKRQGVFTKRMRYFTDGIVIGSEGYIRRHLKAFRKKGRYLRRINPIEQLDGVHFSIREQRSHYVQLN